MDERLHLPAGTAGGGVWTVEVAPGRPGWSHTSLRVLELAAGGLSLLGLSPLGCPPGFLGALGLPPFRFAPGLLETLLLQSVRLAPFRGEPVGRLALQLGLQRG